MKPTIGYAIRRDWGYDIVEITSKTKVYWAGRTIAGYNTRGMQRALVGEYPTLEAAEAAMARIRAVKELYGPRVKDARKLYEAIQASERQAVDAAAMPR